MNLFATCAMSLGMLLAAVQRRLWLQRYRAALSVTSSAACAARRGTSAATAWQPSSATPAVGGVTCRTSAHRLGYLIVGSAGSDNRLQLFM